LLEHIDLERSVLAPAIEGSGQRFQSLFAQKPCQLAAALARKFADNLVDDGQDPFLAEVSGEGAEQGSHDSRLNFTLLNQRQSLLLRGQGSRPPDDRPDST
jgi:hypothetical protein